MKVVHGPGPKWGSMFCPPPHEINVLNRIGLLRHAANKFHKLIDIPHVQTAKNYSLKNTN